MPDEITEALARIASTLPPVNWRAPEELRRRAAVRRRQRRVAVGCTAAVLVALGAVVWQTVPLGPSRMAPGTAPSASGSASSCPAGGVPASIALPDLQNIELNVYNGTTTENLAATVGLALRHRGFVVLITDNASRPAAAGSIADIVYGPSGVGSAWVMQSFFPGATLTFDINRSVSTVDIILGDGFMELPTAADVNRNIAIHGGAIAPAGTCPVSATP